MIDYTEYLYVPKERLGALIGEEGSVKRLIEQKTGVKISVESETGAVDVQRNKADPIAHLKAKEAVQAIAVGFNFKQAMKLLHEDMVLVVVDISEFTKNVTRQVARIIGEHGKAKKRLEQITFTNIAVSGKEVGIIGLSDDARLAKHAVEMLARGIDHKNVYRFIENEARI
ncbi:MAG: RNA-processing protein [Candidatus Diapherotrites archaeon]|nr:RNA-processing protein [Candidatus Diapherotrites archaeon]